MGCEMLAAVGSATVHGGALFGQNIHSISTQHLQFIHEPFQAHVFGEKLKLRCTELKQCQRTYAWVGCRTNPIWGVEHGLNEQGLAIGCAAWESKIGKSDAGLTGPDLVRLTLERANTVERGLDILTDLLRRLGQAEETPPSDNIFYLVDSQTAFVVEAAGPFWTAHELRQVRAASNVALIKQDWHLISAGMADFAIEQGWWIADGTKLDFSGAVQRGSTEDHRSTLKRWARATLLLEQQNGHIDTPTVRQMLSDHFDGTHSEIDALRPTVDPKSICLHSPSPESETTIAALISELPADPGHQPPMMWSCIGPPCLGVFLPLFPHCPIPKQFAELQRRTFGLIDALGSNTQSWFFYRSRTEALQSQIQQETDEYLIELNHDLTNGQSVNLMRACEAMVENCMDRYEAELETLENELAQSLVDALPKE